MLFVGFPFVSGVFVLVAHGSKVDLMLVLLAALAISMGYIGTIAAITMAGLSARQQRRMEGLLRRIADNLDLQDEAI